MRTQARGSFHWQLVALFLLVQVQPQATVIAGPAVTDGPTSREHNVAIIVTKLLQQLHISHREVDDMVSQRAFKLFTESLDPRKLYFLQDDIDEFSWLSTRLDDMVRSGDVDPAYQVFKRFVKRIRERIVVIDELLDGEFDFTIDEVVAVNPDSYPKSSDEARDRWRRELKLQLLFLQASNSEEQANAGRATPNTADVAEDIKDPKEQLRRRYHRVQSRMQRLESDKLFERYMTAIASSYDPHTTYMSPSTLDHFMIAMSLNLEGIGAELREEDGYTSVVRIIDGGAASRDANFNIGDRILAVAQGSDGEWEDTVGMAVDSVALRVRGKPGTTVRLKLLSTLGDVNEVRLVRTRVELKESGASGHVVPFETGEREELRAGYIALPSFYRDTAAMQREDQNFRSCARDVRKMLIDFREQSVDAVVLDLRGNGGGYLEEAIQIVGLFIDRGPVVQVRGPNGRIQVYDDRATGVAWGGPLVVLTSKFSASASEIVAGAIQDYRRGVIVGDPQTHGKGTVQAPINVAEALLGARQKLPNYGALKVTVQTYYLPGGESTQVDGVSADITLPSAQTYASVGERELKYALPKDRVSAASHAFYKMSTPDLVRRLSAASRRRVSDSESFAQITRQMEAVRENADQTHMSIMKSEFDAARELLRVAADSQDEEAGEKEFPNSDYEKEVLEIVQDYVFELAKRNLLSVG